MYGLVKVYDHNIIAINQSNSTIIVRDGKDFHKNSPTGFEKSVGVNYLFSANQV